MDMTAIPDEELPILAPKEKKPSVLLTVLAGLCAMLIAAGVMLGDCMLFGTVSVVFFAGTAPLVWLFTKLFHGRKGGALLTVSAVSAAIVLYLGTAINAAGVFAMAEGWPPMMVPYVTYLMLTDSWMLVTLYTHILYYIIFSLLGVFIVLICALPGKKRKNVATQPLSDEKAAEEDGTDFGDAAAESPDDAATDESMDDAAAAAEAEAAVAAEAEAQAAAEAVAEASLTAAIEAETAAEAAAAEAVSDESAF